MKVVIRPVQPRHSVGLSVKALKSDDSRACNQSAVVLEEYTAGWTDSMTEKSERVQTGSRLRRWSEQPQLYATIRVHHDNDHLTSVGRSDVMGGLLRDGEDINRNRKTCSEINL
ncbi:hypothetical protein J6590_042461 [Homalodisca vitripennis]|nr:hypothetical protein J6590_042461 [Homalodisca vitripennis]